MIPLLSDKLLLQRMYAGYVFVCNTTSFRECLKRKLFTCTADPQTPKEIPVNSVVFLYNEDSNKLAGPFTASTKARLEPGAWEETMDEQSFSLNVRVEWEELHEIQNAQQKFPFLKGLKLCKLTQTQTQDMLDALKKAPLFRHT